MDSINSIYRKIRKIIEMSKMEKLKERYVADADAMASKSRFGYFTMLPSHTAAITDCPTGHPARDDNGRVVTEERNIFSGTTSSPHLQKNYFSYTPSPFHGSQYQDPGKDERLKLLQQSKDQEGKDIFRPSKLSKSLNTASYPYISCNDHTKEKKNCRDSDGKVIVQPPNMLVSPQSKISYNRNKQFKYKEAPPSPKAQKSTEAPDNATEPFRLNSHQKSIFNNDYKTFFDADLKKKGSEKKLADGFTHEGPFKPCCRSKGTPFTPLVYIEDSKGNKKAVKVQKTENKGDAFKLLKVESRSKPCPSIALTKANILRICR